MDRPDATTAAAALFRQWLWDTENPGTPYLAGLTGERAPLPHHIIEGANLGYAHHGYATVLYGWGYTPDELREAGLVDEHHAEVYGDRLSFPWTDMSGRTVLGLGGRAVTMRRPKYVNTPEPLFSKGSAVFGIHQASAAIWQAGYAIVVEGPFDALSLWAMGWTNAVATVGAKVTPDQLAMVLRLTNQAVVLLDDDEGGRRGQQALATTLQRETWPSSAAILTTTLRGAKDPGDPAATVDMVADALERSLPLAHI